MPESPIQELVCCMGKPVAGNPTQFAVERAFAAAGLDWRYLTLEVGSDQLADAVRGMRAMGFRGGNFAPPHHAAVIPYLDEVSEAAALTGAVNCVQRVGDRLLGDNTDGKGFVESLRELTDPAGKNVVLIGAGKAARAIAVELALQGTAEIVVVSRTAERGQQLVDLLRDRVHVQARLVHLSGDYAVEELGDVVVNATPIGTGDPEDRLPLQMETILPHMVVADVVFNPPQTRFLREAAQRDCRTLDGLSMVVHQIAVAFRGWTGVSPDSYTIREALEEFLEV